METFLGARNRVCVCEPKREGKEQRMTSAGRTKWPLVEMGKTVEGAARLEESLAISLGHVESEVSVQFS